MRSFPGRIAALLVCAFAAPAALAYGEDSPAQPASFAPRVGQDGKDVAWVPTPQVLVERILDLARIAPGDYLIDLGSGDGRTVITAAKRGIEALGIEYDPRLVALAKRNARAAGAARKASFLQADLFKVDLARASVVTLFLLDKLNLELRPRLLALRPGTRIVSTVWTMGDWQPDETVTLSAADGCGGRWCTAHLWIVPAQVAGTYSVGRREVTLRQRFQQLTGSVREDGKDFPLEGTVAGDDISFRAGARAYRARLSGRRLDLQ